MGNLRHQTTIIQLRADPEELSRITQELELFKKTVNPPYDDLIKGPFNGFHQDAFTIIILPHGCKDRHTDIVLAHSDLTKRLRKLALSWGDSMDATVQLDFGGGDSERVSIQIDSDGDLMEGDRLMLDYVDENRISVEQFEDYLKLHDLPYEKMSDPSWEHDFIRFLPHGTDRPVRILHKGGFLSEAFPNGMKVVRDLMSGDTIENVATEL